MSNKTFEELFTELSRLAGQDNELGFAGVDGLFGADHVDVDGGVRHQIFLAFSCASSIVPTM